MNRKSLRGNRRGLTLLELVIVLAILAGLASILLPMFPNLLRRAHKSVDATQTSEVAKAMLTHQGLYMSYPDNFDMLTDGTAFPSYLPADGGNPFGGYVKLGTLTNDEQKALARAGVIFAQKLSPNTTPSGFHPTLYPYASTISGDQETIVGSPSQFALLNTTAITNGLLEAERANDPTANYVVFGLGARSSAVGTTIQTAPISVPQNKDFTPDTLYSRIGLVFKVSGTEVGRTERARFVAAVALEDDELEATDKDIVGYYQVARDPRL